MGPVHKLMFGSKHTCPLNQFTSPVLLFYFILFIVLGTKPRTSYTLRKFALHHTYSLTHTWYFRYPRERTVTHKDSSWGWRSTWLVDCLPSVPEGPEFHPYLHKTQHSMAVFTMCCTGEVEAGESRLQDYRKVHIGFGASLKYMSPCLQEIK